MLSEQDFSFWRLLGAMRLRSILWPEGAWAIATGGTASYTLISWTSLETRIAIAGDYLLVIGVLLAVVFATLALVVSLLSDTYLLFLQQSKEGFMPFMAPFIVGVGVQVMSLLGVLAYRAASHSRDGWEPLLFSVATLLFIYSLFDVVSLAKTVAAHAVTRAEHLAAMAAAGQKSPIHTSKPQDSADSSPRRQ